MSNGHENYSNASANYGTHLKCHTIRDSSHSLDLRLGIIPASSGNNERWLVMSNGRTEWLEKYAHLPADFNLSSTTGYLSWDHRGQGASGGARAWIDSYHTYAQDMADVINQSTKGAPYNLICHSMGGLIALTAMMDQVIKPRCVVLCSPLIGMPHEPMPAHAAYRIAKTLSLLGMGHLNTGGGRHWKPPFEDNLLTHSVERYEVIKNTPFPVPSPTFSWIKASYEATQEILKPERLKKLSAPILILSGTAEKVVDIEAIQPWIQAANQHASASVELQWIQGGRHELLFESKIYYEQTVAVAKSWFTKIGFPI